MQLDIGYKLVNEGEVSSTGLTYPSAMRIRTGGSQLYQPVVGFSATRLELKQMLTVLDAEAC